LFDICVESKRYTPELEELAVKALGSLQDIKLSLLTTRKVYGSAIKRRLDTDEEEPELEVSEGRR
jgi:hypothetical protein